MKLAGRVAFVTGGASGIGHATARLFAAEGARVAVYDVDGGGAKETIASLPGGPHLAFAGDVTDGARVVEAFAEVERRCGRLDVLVNDAGVDHVPGDGSDQMLGSSDPILLLMSEDAWSRMLSIHMTGAFLCTKAALPLMLRTGSGSIVNISSIAGLAGIGLPHYSAAKAGVLGLTRSLAALLGARGIRVNAICPGVIDTPMTRAVPEVLMAPLIAKTPLQRRGSAEEVAAVALFLASDDGSFVTGQWISPNGGLVIA